MRTNFDKNIARLQFQSADMLNKHNNGILEEQLTQEKKDKDMIMESAYTGIGAFIHNKRVKEQDNERRFNYANHFTELALTEALSECVEKALLLNTDEYAKLNPEYKDEIRNTVSNFISSTSINENIDNKTINALFEAIKAEMPPAELYLTEEEEREIVVTKIMPKETINNCIDSLIGDVRARVANIVSKDQEALASEQRDMEYIENKELEAAPVTEVQPEVVNDVVADPEMNPEVMDSQLTEELENYVDYDETLDEALTPEKLERRNNDLINKQYTGIGRGVGEFIGWFFGGAIGILLGYLIGKKISTGIHGEKIDALQHKCKHDPECQRIVSEIKSLIATKEEAKLNKPRLRELRKQFASRVQDLKVENDTEFRNAKAPIKAKLVTESAQPKLHIVKEQEKKGILECLAINEATQMIAEGKEYDKTLALANAIKYITVLETLDASGVVTIGQNGYNRILSASGVNMNPVSKVNIPGSDIVDTPIISNEVDARPVSIDMPNESPKETELRKKISDICKTTVPCEFGLGCENKIFEPFAKWQKETPTFGQKLADIPVVHERAEVTYKGIKGDILTESQLRAKFEREGFDLDYVDFEDLARDWHYIKK